MRPAVLRICLLVFAGLGLVGANGCSSGVGAPAGEQPINYTFDHGTEGWVLNKNEGSSFTNLGVGVPDGGSPPTVTFAGSDGDPSPGSLRLTVAFTGPGQYVAAGALFGHVVEGGSVIGGRNLSGTVRARVRLLSGRGAGVLVNLYSCESYAPLGTICTGGPTIDAAELAGVDWTPVVMLFSFPTQVFELGIESYTPMPEDGGAAGGGASANTGELVLEIDTVTSRAAGTDGGASDAP